MAAHIAVLHATGLDGVVDSCLHADHIGETAVGGVGVDVVEELLDRGHGHGEDDEGVLLSCALEGGDELGGDVEALRDGGAGAGAGTVITENSMASGMEIAEQ